MFSKLSAPFRLLSKALVSQNAPRQLALGLALGIALGLVPKGNLTAAMLALCLFSLRVNLAVGLLATFAFTWIAVIVHPSLDQLGLWLLTRPNAEIYIQWLFQKPLLAWSHLDNTVVAGGLLAGIVQLPFSYLLGGRFFRAISHEKERRRFELFSGILRLQYFVPRTALFVLFVGLCALTIRPTIHLGLLYAGAQLTGSHIEFAESEADFGANRLILHDLCLAHPDDRQRVLLSAEKVNLEIDRKALWYRRLDVKRGEIVGLRLDATPNELATSDMAEQTPPATVRQRDLTQATRDWLNQNLLTSETARSTDPIASKLVAQLTSQWSAEFERLEQESGQAKSQVNDALTLLKTSSENSLRNLFSVEEAAAGLDAASDQLARIQSDLDRVDQQMLIEQEQLATPAQRETEMFLPVSSQTILDPQTVSEYLLGQELHQKLATVLQWHQLCRSYLPDATRQVTRHNTQSGQRVIFPGINDGPDIVVHNLNLRGIGLFDDVALQWKGYIQHLTSNPEVQECPTIISLMTLGETPTTINMVMANGPSQSNDRIMIDVQVAPTPARSLGAADCLVVHAGPCNTHLSASMELDNNQIVGELRIRQNPAELTASVPNQAFGELIAEDISRVLAQMDTIEAVVKVSGTIEAPMWKLQSNLGVAVADQLEKASSLVKLAQQQRQMAQQKAHVDQLIAQAEQDLAPRRIAIQENLQLNNEEIERAMKRVADLVKPFIRRPRTVRSGEEQLRR
jgi:uncharacterized protein (TIGR03546 family)/uncharacterized protein (TIGR03545 family)